MGSLRFGALVLAYNQEEYISYCVRALAPHVEHLVVVFSQRPWTQYNRFARHMFTVPDATIHLLEGLQRSFAHLSIVEGIWDCEEDMRNAGLRALRRAGVEVCLNVDADEFYPEDGLKRLKKEIERRNAPGHRYYLPYVTCFKRFDHVLARDWVAANDRVEWMRAAVAVHLDAETEFSRMRHATGVRVDLPPTFFFWHMGYVLSDRRMWEKVHSWGHASQLLLNWFEEKWLGWTPQTKDLFYRDPPHRWPSTIAIDPRSLPAILHSHPYFPRHQDAGLSHPPNLERLTPSRPTSPLPLE